MELFFRARKTRSWRKIAHPGTMRCGRVLDPLRGAVRHTACVAAPQRIARFRTAATCRVRVPATAVTPAGRASIHARIPAQSCIARCAPVRRTVARSASVVAGDDGAEVPEGISKITGTPIVRVHHPEHERMMPALIKATSPAQLLALYAEEREHYGWYTAKETITRIARYVTKKPRGAFLDRKDERFLGLMGVVEMALRQNMMTSKARLGHSTDDLSTLKAAMEGLGVTEGPAYSMLCAQLAEEADEEDEPGEFGHDFQGGSMGF